MKILWHSVAPWVGTGYGQQTALFTPRLRDLGHDVTISSMYGIAGAAMDYDGIAVLPGDEGKYGNYSLPAHVKHYEPDLVIGLLDAWVLDPGRMRDFPLALWCPVDHDPCPPAVAEFFRRSGATPIAMSRFGEEQLLAEGLLPLYVPHGVDTNLFAPRDKARLGKEGADEFVVGMVANNSGGRDPVSGPPRKAFPEAFAAFSLFHDRHPDSRLYLHTEMDGHSQYGLNLYRLIEQMKIPPEAVTYTNQQLLQTGMPAEGMARLFSSFDVLLNPSYGEGFGLPIIEAQACGTPVIVSDWTSMPELCCAGWKVGGQPWYDPQPNRGEAWWLAPSVEEIGAALELAYESREDQALRDRARKFALDYDADTVVENHWKPALEVLSKPREVPPLNGNRAQRRAAARSKVPA